MFKHLTMNRSILDNAFLNKLNLDKINLDKLRPKTISRIAVCAAILLAPLMTYGSAYLVYSQMDKVSTKQSEAVQVKAPTKVSLSRADSAQIAANIALAGI